MEAGKGLIFLNIVNPGFSVKPFKVVFHLKIALRNARFFIDSLVQLIDKNAMFGPRGFVFQYAIKKILRVSFCLSLSILNY